MKRDHLYDEKLLHEKGTNDSVTEKVGKMKLDRSCPRCGSKNCTTERRPNGNSRCIDCGFDGPTKDFDELDVHTGSVPKTEPKVGSRPGEDAIQCKQDYPGNAYYVSTRVAEKSEFLEGKDFWIRQEDDWSWQVHGPGVWLENVGARSKFTHVRTVGGFIALKDMTENDITKRPEPLECSSNGAPIIHWFKPSQHRGQHMTKAAAKKAIMRIVKEELPKIRTTRVLQKNGMIQHMKTTKVDEKLSRKWSKEIARLMKIVEEEA